MRSLPTLRRKILRSFWGLLLLYGVLGFILVVSVQIASHTSPRMIHVNYDSISAAGQMREALQALAHPLEHPQLGRDQALKQFETALSFETSNVTEPGERELAQAAQSAWSSLRSLPAGQLPVAGVHALDGLLDRIVAVNEGGMFRLAQQNEQLSTDVMIGAIAFFFLSLIASLFAADGLARRISMPLKNIAEALHRRPAIGRKLKLVEPDTLELLILTSELGRLWERVTESEKLNVREILQQKTKLESVLESVEDALLVIDTGGTILHANQTLLALLEMSETDVTGKRWADLSAMGENYLKLRALLNAEMPDSAELDLLLKSVKRQYSARYRSISSPGDVPMATLYLLHDITEKRQRERFRSEFIDMLSHEIKTPLQSLGTATELLADQRRSLPETIQPLIETISEDVERIKAVANEFVQVTQSHSRIMRLKLELTPMNQVLPEWIKPFHVVARDRSVRLRFEQKGSEVIWANLDRVKFPWVVSNLLSNAIRFAPSDSEVVVLLSDRNGAIEIQVMDSGPGVSEEDRRRIFEPFFQSPMATSTGQKGLFGIGLTITKEVVEAHEGRIEYYPRMPHGSEFRIVLPFPPS